jgi:hypothetical protein
MVLWRWALYDANFILPEQGKCNRRAAFSSASCSNPVSVNKSNESLSTIPKKNRKDT